MIARAMRFVLRNCYCSFAGTYVVTALQRVLRGFGTRIEAQGRLQGHYTMSCQDWRSFTASDVGNERLENVPAVPRFPPVSSTPAHHLSVVKRDLPLLVAVGQFDRLLLIAVLLIVVFIGIASGQGTRGTGHNAPQAPPLEGRISGFVTS